MPEPPSSGLVGRSAELADVDAFLEASEQRFTVLAVEGEPGIGKTVLWHESVRRAQSRGARVLVTRATELEAGLSLAGLGDLFDGIDESTLERLPAPQREALLGALLRVAVGERGIDERSLCAGVLSVLRNLASDCPVLVAIDDAQWLDASSGRVLSFAMRRLDPERVGVLVTVRVWDGAGVSFIDAAAAGRRRALRLGPLSVSALHEVIKNQTGTSLSRPMAVQVARSCAGNPLYSLQIARNLSGTSSDRLSVPASLRELITARLERLPTRTRQALAAAAAASHPTTALVDGDALLPAVREGIVRLDRERVDFAHPLFASVVYGLLGIEGRRAVHRLLADRVADPEESARHAALAALGPDRATASRLDAAAATAERRGAPAAAAELAELALGSTPREDVQRRCERRLAGATYWLAAGDLGRAQELLEAVLQEAPSRSLRARALQLLGQLRSRRSSFAAAALVAEEALALVDADLELRAAIELDIVYCHANFGDLEGAERHARAAVEAASSAQQPGILAEALGVVTLATFLLGRGTDERALATAVLLEDAGRRSPIQMRPSYHHGQLAVWSGKLDEGLAILERVHDEALERGEESPIPLLDFYLVWGWLWRGDLGRATERAAEAGQLAALLGDHGAAGSALVCSALVHAHSGSVAEVRTEAAEAVRRFEQLSSPVFIAFALWALGLAELSVGNPAAAHAALGAVADRLLTMGPLDPTHGVFLPDEIEALIGLGELERAEPLVEWLSERGAALDRSWALAAAGRCRALLSAAQGNIEGAFAAFDAALVQHDRSQMPFDRARTLFVLGRLQRRTRQRSRAGATLAEALDLFERFGAQRWAERAAAELEPLRVRSAHPDQLTSTEALVAELAARGLPNRLIAQQAMLSVKTVEANLTRVYRKLDVRSREALGEALRAAGRHPHS